MSTSIKDFIGPVQFVRQFSTTMQDGSEYVSIEQIGNLSNWGYKYSSELSLNLSKMYRPIEDIGMSSKLVYEHAEFIANNKKLTAIQAGSIHKLLMIEMYVMGVSDAIMALCKGGRLKW